MVIKKEPGKIHLILEVGDEVMSTLAEVAKHENVQSACIVGIGGIIDVTLGVFNLQQKKYIEKDFPGNWELVSLVGSISWYENEPVVHAHACLGRQDYKSYSGHLIKAPIIVTGEIFLYINETKLERKINPDLGLKLIS